MKSLKELMIVLCASSLACLFLVTLPGCQSTSSRNDLLVDVAVTQGVIRYVDAGATDVEDAQRRERLIGALSVARQFVHSNEPFDVSAWPNEFLALMDWDSLAPADQILLSQVLELVRQEIELRTADQEQVRVSLGRLIDVAINTAGRL